MHNRKSAGHQNTDVSDEELKNLRKNNDDENDVGEFGYNMHAIRYQPKDVAVGARTEDWDDAATAVSGVTSEFAYSDFDVSIPWRSDFCCARYGGALAAAVTGFLSLISPILMVIIPKAGVADRHVSTCGVDCQAILVGLGIRLFLLVIATCVLFLRSPRSTMPRVFVYRAIIVFLLFVIMSTFWLFYMFRVFGNHLVPTEQSSSEEENVLFYEDIVGFATSFADVLVFVHYIAVVVIELRQLNVVFVVKVTRSPDGATQSYSVGRLSIQRLAVWCLDQYYRDFQVSCC